MNFDTEKDGTLETVIGYSKGRDDGSRRQTLVVFIKLFFHNVEVNLRKLKYLTETGLQPNNMEMIVGGKYHDHDFLLSSSFDYDITDYFN